MSKKIKESEIICVIDRSGSMGMVTNDTIGGFNTFLKEQKKLPDKAKMTTILFDHEYLIKDDNIDIKKVKSLNTDTYIPRGTTALIDAIGKTIASVKERIGKKKNNIIFVIITDGCENASKEYKTDQIKDMIKEQTKRGWDFLYLGANQDSFTEAGNFGISARNTSNYSNDKDGIATAYCSIGLAATGKRGSGLIDKNWKADVK